MLKRVPSSFLSSGCQSYICAAHIQEVWAAPAADPVGQPRPLLQDKDGPRPPPPPEAISHQCHGDAV